MSEPARARARIRSTTSIPADSLGIAGLFSFSLSGFQQRGGVDCQHGWPDRRRPRGGRRLLLGHQPDRRHCGRHRMCVRRPYARTKPHTQDTTHTTHNTPSTLPRHTHNTPISMWRPPSPPVTAAETRHDGIDAVGWRQSCSLTCASGPHGCFRARRHPVLRRLRRQGRRQHCARTLLHHRRLQRCARSNMAAPASTAVPIVLC